MNRRTIFDLQKEQRMPVDEDVVRGVEEIFKHEAEVRARRIAREEIGGNALAKADEAHGAENDLLALERHRKSESDPVMQRRLDRAIDHARGTYAKTHGIGAPEAIHAEDLRKAEHEISAAGIAQRRAAELRKAEPDLSQHEALARAMRDPEVQRAHADEAGIAA